MRHEDAILRSVIRWADDAGLVWPEAPLLYHIPNEGRRTAREGARAKREGLRPGLPDLHLPVARRGYYGLWIELKTPGGRLTQNQRTWLDVLGRQGYKALVCYSADEAIREIEHYLRGEKTK